MAVISNNQTFSASASGTTIQGAATQFRAAMDSVLLGMGRNITLHLQPSQVRCPDPTCRFNDVYKKFIGANGAPCRTCGGTGFFLETRQTVYIANIRWLDDPLMIGSSNSEDAIGGRLYSADVRTKTVAASYNDILNCVAAEIDGIPVKLKTEPRRTGFGGNLYYTVAYWERQNKKTNV
jgi:hypothetical protein